MLNINHILRKLLNKQLYIFTMLITLFINQDLMSQATSGGYSQSYLMRNVGARPISMAGAYTAIANDPFAVFYNPAGLGFFSSQPIISTSASNLGFGRTNATLAYGQQVTDEVGVGFGLNTMFSGAFTHRDVKGNPHGEIASNQYTLAAFGAYSMEFASMGVGLKYLIDNLAGERTEATGVALDIGAKFNVMDLFSFGIAIQNVSGIMLWNTRERSTENIPYTIRTGIAMEYGLNDRLYTTRSATDGSVETVYEPATRYVLVGLDAVYGQYDLSPTFVIGTELVLHELIGFRGGISIYGDKLGTPQLFPMTYWGAGISLRPELEELMPGIPFKTYIDYSVSPEIISNSGIMHNISLVFEF